MGEPVRVSVPHRLGRIEARRRIEDGLVRLRAKVAEVATSIEYRWNGDDLTFNAVALGQSINGRLMVREAAVDVEVSLPGMLSMFGKTVTAQIKDRGVKLLGHKPD